MIELLVYIVVLVIIFGVLFYVIDMLPMDPSLKQIAKVILGLVLILVLLAWVFGGYSFHGMRSLP